MEDYPYLKPHMLETSLQTYLKFLYLNYPQDVSIQIMGVKQKLENPYYKHHTTTPQFFKEMSSVPQSQWSCYIVNPNSLFKPRESVYQANGHNSNQQNHSATKRPIKQQPPSKATSSLNLATGSSNFKKEVKYVV